MKHHISAMRRTTIAATLLATGLSLAACADDIDGGEHTDGGDSSASAQETSAANSAFDSDLDAAAEPEAMIAEGVNIPAGATLYKTSGIGPEALNTDAADDDPMAYVDSAILVNGKLPDGMSVTEAQGLNVLKRIRALLQKQGLDVQDVATMRVFVQGAEGKEPDFDGWNRAYRQYFANTDLRSGNPMQLAMGTSEEKSDPTVINPTRPTRFAVGVAQLPVKGWLVEVEVDAYRSEE